MTRLFIILAVAMFPAGAAFGQGAFDTAVNVLISGGYLPGGWSVSIGTNPGAYGDTFPDEKRIEVNLDTIATTIPGIDINNVPGVIFYVLVHEAAHACEADPACPNTPVHPDHPGPYNTPCGEYKLQRAISAKMCDAITALIEAGGDPGALCMFYNIQRASNNKKFEPGGIVEGLGCGPDVTKIPACSACEQDD